MPTLLTHPLVPVTARVALGSRRMPVRLFWVSVVFSLLPDADVASFAFGIPYGHPLGHRGFFHSVTFAALAAGMVAWAGRGFGVGRKAAFLLLWVAMASHGFLDAMTDGGKGIALLSPFTNERFFLPWRFVPVSPIGVSRFFSDRGVHVLTQEMARLWAPLLIAGVLIGLGRWIAERGRRGAR